MSIAADRRPLDEAEVAELRRRTPGVREGAVFLNAAGSALPDEAVLDAVIAHLRLEAHLGGYRAAAEAAPHLAATRAALGRLLGAQPEEIALLGSASEAWRLCLYGVDLRPGDRVLVGRAAYGGNAIGLLHRAALTGAEIEVVDDDEHGQIDIADLEQRLAEGPAALLCLTHGPTGSGLVNPAAEGGALAKAHGVPFLLDACQSVGQMPLDVEELGCDFLSGTSRKYLRGPRGVGFLWVRPSLLDGLEPPMLDNTSATWTGEHSYRLQPGMRRFETYESAVAARVGLGVAVEQALALGLERIEARITHLAAHLRRLLSEIPGVHVADRGQRLCGIVTFHLEGWPTQELRRALVQRDVEVSVTSRESSRWLLAPELPEELVRASVHLSNTEDELAHVAHMVDQLSRRGP